MNGYEVITTAQADRWRAVLPADASAMGSVEYARIAERYTGSEARLFVLDDGESVIAYPYFQRPVQSLAVAAGRGEPRWDTFTAEYTGPIRIGPPLVPTPTGAGPRFTDAFAAYCRDQRIVAEFAHLSPWVSPDLLDPDCVRDDREIVYLDLTWGEEALWKRSLTSDTRRQVKQAQRAGVRVRRAGSIDDVREFHRLHALTMDRLHAGDRYRYALEQFIALFEEMPDNVLFALAEYQGRIVAGGLFFHGATEVVWHLSAADMAFSGVRPVNAYVFETVRWAVRHGKRRMICGGAYEAGDGVFHFKAGFSPLRAPFRTYRRVHDPEAYAALNRAWSVKHGGASPTGSFFPSYRTVPPERAAVAASRDEASPTTIDSGPVAMSG